MQRENPPNFKGPVKWMLIIIMVTGDSDIVAVVGDYFTAYNYLEQS